MREPGGDVPIVPFKDIAGGFKSAIGNRQEFIDYFKENPSIGRYGLYGTAANGEKELVVEVSEGKLNVLDLDKFDALTSDPSEEVTRLSNSIIDDIEINRVTYRLPDGVMV